MGVWSYIFVAGAIFFNVLTILDSRRHEKWERECEQREPGSSAMEVTR